MPIYLPAISRRTFLARSLAAGAAMMLSPRLLAANEVDEHCWALLSDIHLAADRGRIAREVNMTENFKAVVQEVLALRKRPVGTLICGDLAFNTGETADYANLIELLQPMRGSKIPVHLVLGNHDNRERFWDALVQEKAAERPLKDRHASIIRTARANWFVLDSLDTTNSTPGVLGHAQLAWLEKALDQNAKKPALVMVHHNPNPEGRSGGLNETKELFDLMRPRKQVKAYLFGHTHVWSVAQDPSGIHLINLPTTAYRFDPRYPHGWIMANLEKRGMRLEFRGLDQKHQEHGRVLNLKWRT